MAQTREISLKVLSAPEFSTADFNLPTSIDK